MKLEWGTALDKQPDALQWAFVGNGAQPGLAPVTAGYQLVLVYSVSEVSAVRKLSTLIDCAASPLWLRAQVCAAR